MKYQNKQRWCECQLVALWNAHKLLVPIPPKFGTENYKEICGKSKCIYGGCIDIEKEKQRLKLVSVRGIYKLWWVRQNLPVHFCVFHPTRGYHSVLAVRVNRNKILLANYAQGRLYWLSWQQLLKKCSKKTKPFSYKFK